MKIVADENIPLVANYFANCGELVLKPGREIQQSDLMDADILLVRSVTNVNEKLLHGTSVKFVGSATAGLDHLDTAYLAREGIAWANAAGCNAVAVVEHVLAIIVALQTKGFLLNKNLRAAVIGVGTIGKQVVEKLKILGFEVVQCDPVRAQQEPNFKSVAFSNLTEFDLITLHTPLTFEGRYPTYHMVNGDFLKRQKADGILLNAARGSVINFADLQRNGKHLHWCLDVWENEPNINLGVLQDTLIATPHIAGYSIQSKYRGIEMIYQAALDKKIIENSSTTYLQFPKKQIDFNNQIVNWRDVILKNYDVRETSLQMKEVLLNNKNTFDNLRKEFANRYELNYVDCINCRIHPEDQVLLKKLLVIK